MKHQFRNEDQRKVVLTEIEKRTILALDPSFVAIARALSFDNYNLPCPIRVDVQTKGARGITVVLRKARHGSVEVEVEMLRALKEFGLPVPEVLSAPFQNETGEYAAVYSLLPGVNLQRLSMRSEEGLQESKRLLIEAVVRLTRAGDFIARHRVAASLPRHTLLAELETACDSIGPWSKEEVFQSAVQRLRPVLADTKTPLVFSNGDYQPGNFLANDGEITGFLDFESPSFQDPLMGFAKFPIYDMLPLSRTDFIEMVLETLGFSGTDFSPRLALGCLKTMQREIPVTGGDSGMCKYRERVLTLLKSALR
jgi:hypothetical protein